MSDSKGEKRGVQGNSTSASHRLQAAYDTVRWEVLYNILIVLGVPMTLDTLNKMCLIETCSKIRTGKHLSVSFTIQNGLKQDSLSPLCCRRSKEIRWN
jgi:hypothetical protein